MICIYYSIQDLINKISLKNLIILEISSSQIQIPDSDKFDVRPYKMPTFINLISCLT